MKAMAPAQVCVKLGIKGEREREREREEERGRW